MIAQRLLSLLLPQQQQQQLLLLLLLLLLSSGPSTGFMSNRRSQRIAALTQTNDNDEPILTVGVLADIQYAPIPDGFSFGGKPRYYQGSLEAARYAAKEFESHNVDLVINLGDILDGKCQFIEGEGGTKLPDGVDPGEECVTHVLQALSYYSKGPILHTYGNHELYNLDRPMLGKKLNIPFTKEGSGDLVGYYSQAFKGIRFVILDTYDINILQRDPDTSPKRKAAQDILERENINYPAKENSPEGLVGVQKRFVAFNGGIDTPQLEWLEETLVEAREKGEKVILMSHQPILPESCSPVTLVWNYRDVIKVLREFRDVIMISLSGHAHKGGYKRDSVSGIHFRVVEAMLESKPPVRTFGYLDVYKDRVEFRGEGECKSATYDTTHCSSSKSRVDEASRL